MNLSFYPTSTRLQKQFALRLLLRRQVEFSHILEKFNLSPGSPAAPSRRRLMRAQRGYCFLSKRRVGRLRLTGLSRFKSKQLIEAGGMPGIGRVS